MSRFVVLASGVFAAAVMGFSPAEAKENKGPKPIQVEIQVEACGSVTAGATKEEVCYVYDVIENEEYMEVSIAGGLLAAFGSGPAGGEFSAVVNATVRFPLGTKEKDAMTAARNELNKQLKNKKVVSFVKENKGDPKKIKSFSEIEETENEDPIDKILREIFEGK